MSNALSRALETRDWLLTDGATGTNLFNMGLQSGDAPEFWNEIERDKIRKLHQDAVDAGSDLFLTNSFGANASRLKLHDAGHRAYELSKLAAELGREIADKSDRDIIVAGSVGPTGEIMGAAGSLSHESAVEMFEETAKGLMDGGADVLWVETISAPEEFRAAAEAFANIDAPWCGTMSFDSAGRTMMGVTSVQLVDLVASLPNQPVAFGANCGVGASDLLRTLKGFASKEGNVPLIAKANAGIPQYVDGAIHYNGTPELMADYAVLARDAGARIIGGCCGTLPSHLRAMRDILENSERGDSPTLELIAERIGGFSSETDGTEVGGGVAATPARRSRRRRSSGDDSSGEKSCDCC
ncbi:betaine--homocysteine S-methyltransferase [Tropicibacter sp. R15_0]|uniref:betaine--homocysteine S-methyltransferase n=1 Tax=Tropicibacter sp. R15_0 TaxID=2821101 RepID=UPI001ADB532B|nr:betaine--homocysteine S-methyltransferase [Tropicibacter sp. R15_0]MBO9466799.1 betaine--homocysteine S-methyltransferase [Tropicibacter sp. R15_0]